MVRARKPRPTSRPATFDTVRQIALSFPGVEEGTSYGTPAFKVRRKFMLRLKEDGENIAIKIDFAARDVLMDSDPETFFITDHYRDYPAMLVSLARVRREDLQMLVEGAWRMGANKKLIEEYERGET